MITISRVSKRFGAVQVLQSVEAVIAPARVTAILGPNGAGKTTLIKTLLGLTRPDAGTLFVAGYEVNDDPAYRARIGYMPQAPRFPENLTGAELLAVLADLRDPATPQDRELVDAFQLGRELTKPLRTLSGGTRQKINAALAFLFSPDLLVLDEPTAGLDPVASGVLKDKIRAERDRGRTFVLTSHVMSEVDELADDILLLIDGVVRFGGSVEEAKVRTRQLNLERAIAQLMRAEAA